MKPDKEEKQDLNEQSKRSFDEEYEKIVDEMNSMSNSIASMGRSIFNIATDQISNINNRTKDYANKFEEANEKGKEYFQELKDLVNEVWHEDDIFSNQQSNHSIDQYFPKPYQNRELSTVENDKSNGKLSGNSWYKSDHEFHRNDFDSFFFNRFPFSFDNMFENRWTKGRTPFGLFSYKNPNELAYNECMKKDGESIWDSYGYWRCLFPNAAVPEHKLKEKNSQFGDVVLTKEDYHSALSEKGLEGSEKVIDLGKKGIFFNQFTDYLNWKNAMYENIKRDKAIRRENNLTTGVNDEPDLATNKRNVTSYSVSSSYRSDDEGVYVKEVRNEQLEDGTWNNKTIIKRKPLDSEDWIIEETNDNDPQPLKGWFWNGKDN